MSDIPLPLWNKEETDVLPQYRLSYGHALIGAPLTRATLEAMARQLGLGRLAYEGPLDYLRLPKDESGQFRTFGTVDEAHLLVADLDGCHAVFGPHMLFFNNQSWIRWNKPAGGLMAIVARYDLTARSCRVFRDGILEANGWAEGRTLRFPQQPDIEVYLHKELVYRSSDPKVEAKRDVVLLLQKDAEVSDDDGRLRVSFSLTEGQVAPDRLAHYIFAR